MSTNYGEWDVPAKEGVGEFKTFEIPPEGAIPARVCAMLDVGTHESHDLKGNVYDRWTLILGFELNEQDSAGNNFFLAKHYTLSMDIKSNLYGVVKSLHGEVAMGDKLNPGWIAGKPCLLQVSNTSKIKRGKERHYANIDSVGKPPRGVVCPPGGCVVWRVIERATTPLPDVSFLPPIWHEGTGKVLTIPEWVQESREVRGANAPPSRAGDTRLPQGNGPAVVIPQQTRRAATPVTQAEADELPPF